MDDDYIPGTWFNIVIWTILIPLAWIVEKWVRYTPRKWHHGMSAKIDRLDLYRAKRKQRGLH